MANASNHPDILARELAPRLGRLIITLRRETAVTGLTRSQLTVLGALREGGARRITELAALEQVTQPSMTVMVSRMARLGWVSRRQDPADRRGVQVLLTDSGRQQHDQALAAYVDTLAGRMRRIDAHHRAALAAAIEALDAVTNDSGEEKSA